MLRVGDKIGSYKVIELLDNEVVGYCAGNIDEYVLWKYDLLDDVRNAKFFKTYEDAIDEVEIRHRYER